MNHKINEEEHDIGRMAVSLSKAIEISDSANKEGCIYATLCILKESMPNEFEEALVIFLKYGTGKDVE